MTFEQWMDKVDDIFIERTGLGYEDWPDQCYYDWFEDEMTPEEAFRDAVENEYGDMDLEAFGLA